MGLHKQYLKVGQNARDQIFGLSRGGRTSSPLSMLISKGAKLNNSKSYNFFLLVILIRKIKKKSNQKC